MRLSKLVLSSITLGLLLSVSVAYGAERPSEFEVEHLAFEHGLVVYSVEDQSDLPEGHGFPFFFYKNKQTEMEEVFVVEGKEHEFIAMMVLYSNDLRRRLKETEETKDALKEVILEISRSAQSEDLGDIILHLRANPVPEDEE